MINALLSERIKLKHRFIMKLLWLGPLTTITLALVLMRGAFFVEGAFNWWYTTLLPGTLVMIIAFNISAEKKHNRHGLLAVVPDKRKLWIAKLLLNTLLLFLITIVFFLFLLVIGIFLGLPIPIGRSFIASIVLFMTFIWQIPFLMFLSEVFGPFISIIIALVFNVGFAIFFAPSPLWWLPFGIPARLMCPIIHVLPNGLPLTPDHRLGDPSVILIGILINTTLYVILSLTTTLWFNHREVN